MLNLNKAVIAAMSPLECELISRGEKTVFVRKTKPDSDAPFTVYLYCALPKEKRAAKDCVPSDFLGTYHNDGKVTLVMSRNECGMVNGKIVGEFVCDKIEKIKCAVVPYVETNNLGYEHFLDNGVYKFTGTDKHNPNDGAVFERQDSFIDSMLKNVDFEQLHLTPQDVFKFIGGFGKSAYLWHMSELKIHDKPKELSEFRKPGFLTEEDWLFALYPNTHCHYAAWAKKFELSKPPSSWCYCEKLIDGENKNE